MELAKIRMPNLNADGLQTDDKLEMIVEYMLSLEKQMRFVLNNLEEDNLGTSLAGALNAASKVASAGYDEQISQKLSRGDIENSLNATRSGKVLDAYQGRLLSEQKLSKTDFKSMVLQSVYPVGSLYISAANTEPGTFLGGTWERIKDMFLLAAGDSYAAGSTGGEAEVTLTTEQMPAHNHATKCNYISTATSESGSTMVLGDASSSTTTDETIEAAGGGKAHNNMPPYIAVYVWKRTA